MITDRDYQEAYDRLVTANLVLLIHMGKLNLFQPEARDEILMADPREITYTRDAHRRSWHAAVAAAESVRRLIDDWESG